MKKLIPIVLALTLLFSFTACTQNVEPSASNKYDVFPNTDWGMTKDEVITALKLNEKDYDDKLIESRTNGDYGFTIKQKQLGQDATVEFLFLDKYPEPAMDTGLYMVVVRIDDTNADLVEATKKLDEQFEKSDKVHKYAESIRDKKVITREKDDSSELNQTGNSYRSILAADALEDATVRDKTVAAIATMSHGMNYSNEPLTEVRITKNAHTNEVSVIYNGLFAAISNNV